MNGRMQIVEVAERQHAKHEQRGPVSVLCIIDIHPPSYGSQVSYLSLINAFLI